MELKEEVKRWKSDMKSYIPMWKPEGIGVLFIHINYHADFFFKNGKIRKIDLSNLEKVAIDTIAEKYGFDDCTIWEKTTNKTQEDSGKEYMEVVLGELNHGGRNNVIRKDASCEKSCNCCNRTSGDGCKDEGISA